jgi:predicted ATPase
MAELLANCGRHIDDLRAAFDWAFSSQGDVALGVTLTTAAVPLWMHLSLLEECRGRVERALAGFAVSATGGTRGEMKLRRRLVHR